MSGQRTPTRSTTGMAVVRHVSPPPVMSGGNQWLFLRPVDDQFAALLHGFPTHTPVLLDGVAFVEAGKVTITDSTAQDAAQLLGKTIDEITAQL